MHVNYMPRRKQYLHLLEEISCYSSNYDVEESSRISCSESRFDYEEACDYVQHLGDYDNLALSIHCATPSNFKTPSILVEELDISY